MSASTFTTRKSRARESSGMVCDQNGLKKFAAGVTVSIETKDFDEFREFALGWNIQHQLTGAKRPHTKLGIVMTPSFQIGVVHHAMGYCSQGQNPKGTISFPIRFEEDRPMILRGRRIEPLQMGVIRGSQGFELICTSGAHLLIASVAQERVERFASDIWHQPDMWQNSSNRLRFQDSEHRARYVDSCEHILEAVRAQPALLNQQRSAALLEEIYLESLLLESHVEPLGPLDLGRYKAARQAYRYLQDQADEAPTIRELCSVTGASYITLERGFHEIYGMSPKAMMTALRLSRVRTQLLHADPSTKISDVALRWGFVEFGRFSVQYRQRFGETPRETLHGRRGTAQDL